MRVIIVDYGMGNIYSIRSALKYLCIESEFTSEPKKIINADKIILPGVGSFKKAMENIASRELLDPIKESVLIKGKHLLGICLGMQLLGLSSTEDEFTKGLELFNGKVERFDEKGIKVPHIGFNEVTPPKGTLLFKGLENKCDFYFIHSFKMKTKIKNGIATSKYGEEFVAAFEQNNIFGTQFHPEKSQSNGLILLNNFLLI